MSRCRAQQAGQRLELDKDQDEDQDQEKKAGSVKM
jgi:hypothetical protein